MVQNLSDNPLFKALDKQYDAEIAAAYATALIYFDNPVGIGEHPQHLEELDKLEPRDSVTNEEIDEFFAKGGWAYNAYSLAM